MTCPIKSGAKSHFRGHPIIWEGEVDNGRWLYVDTLEPLPGWGGEARSCTMCGSAEWSGEGKPDQCLGNLPRDHSVVEGSL